VTIPAERLGEIELSERDALVDIAIGLYKRQEISLGRAAEIAGVSSVEFLEELGRRRIPINYDADDLGSPSRSGPCLAPGLFPERFRKI
jgi:predicted HTH domain antitoxin